MTAISLALSILGTLPVLAAIWYWVQRFQRGRRILRFSRTAPIDLVLTTSSVKRATHGVPASRPLTGYGQVRAVASCVRALTSLYPGKDVTIHLSGFIRNRLDRDLVILGGPAKNEAAVAFLEDFLRAHDLRKLSFDDVADTLEIADYHGREFSIKDFDPHIAGGYPATDYGLIILTDHSGGNDRPHRSILCAGFTTYGTAASAEYLFEDLVRLSPRKLARRTGIRARRHSTAFVVVVSARFSRGECTEVRPVFALAVNARRAERLA
ncbi:hypothetical protein [Acrocarpospora catenulata]|uniref:hypothetical protein n=1 Tax=Acrocarpospora catenulata TaxID=2836182 RepID=UPI001BD957DA|nr:hypothetical protein [Acrocarpospora catenulata]